MKSKCWSFQSSSGVVAAAVGSPVLTLFAVLSLMLVSGLETTLLAQPAGTKPNIVLILADDLGYGDLSCYNPTSKIPTPNLDRLATQGMRFTDAHAPSAVCTPTRYGLLTGRYAWRTTLKSGVLSGYSPPLVTPGRETIASLLKSAGYHTACIGKWHLGMNLPTSDGRPLRSNETGVPQNADWKGTIKNGPTSLGFHYFYGCTASWDMPPYAWIENDYFVQTELVPTEPADRFGRPGVKSPGMKPSHALPAITHQAVDFILDPARKKAGQPFFLYFPLTAPHAPVAPNAYSKGKSQAGDYGDFVVEVDAAVGRIVSTLETAGLITNTLLIFTSDNGPENPMELRKTEYQHFSAAHFLGHKRDNWEGGHRVPFIARWPGKVPAGTTSDEVLCLTDIMATTAALIGRALPPSAGEDSYNQLDVLIGAKPNHPVREATVHHSSTGQFAIRQGQWKLLLHPGSGGNNYRQRPEYAAYFEKPVQLYDLCSDPGETVNLAEKKPEIVEKLTALMKRCITEGRSTPGPAQSNDTPNSWAQLGWMMKPGTSGKSSNATGSPR